jgi:hypothetical protein
MTVATETALIPVRALNQVTYCPRLYYLEYVEGLMPTNEHVEGGLFEHRKVNAPELANRTRKEGEALHTRSVSFSSEQLGITGTLDVVEEKGRRAFASIPEQFLLLVTCRDEKQQVELLQRFHDQGIQVKALIS